jgi:hypothetical protein
MAVAKKHAVDVLGRERTARTFAGQPSPERIDSGPVVQEFFEPNTIKDEQLRMMFSC